MKCFTLLLTALLAATAALGATLPFIETFETNPPTMAHVEGPVHGQNGWVDTSSNAVVQTRNAWEFDQASKIIDAELSQSFTDVQTNVWSVFAWIPSAGGIDAEQLPADATVVVWVNTNGTLSAYSNQTPVETAVSVSTSNWSRVQVHSDYATEMWSLWLDGTQVINQFGFYTNTLTQLSELRFTADEQSSLYLDDVRVSTDTWNPQPGDTDNDNLDDIWELLYFKSLNVIADGDGNNDGDLLTDGEEEIAGTDPTNADSIFEITEGSPQDGNSAYVIHWSSVAGRVYSVDSRSNLLFDTWSNIESNIAATPPDNVYTVLVDSAETKFIQLRVDK